CRLPTGDGRVELSPVRSRQSTVVPNLSHLLPRIRDFEFEVITNDGADIADLAAGLRVEGRFVEANLKITCRQCILIKSGADLDDIRVRFHRVITDELRFDRGIARGEEQQLLILSEDIA